MTTDDQDHIQRVQRFLGWQRCLLSKYSWEELAFALNKRRLGSTERGSHAEFEMALVVINLVVRRLDPNIDAVLSVEYSVDEKGLPVPSKRMQPRPALRGNLTREFGAVVGEIVYRWREEMVEEQISKAPGEYLNLFRGINSRAGGFPKQVCKSWKWMDPKLRDKKYEIELVTGKNGYEAMAFWWGGVLVPCRGLLAAPKPGIGDLRLVVALQNCWTAMHSKLCIILSS